MQALNALKPTDPMLYLRLFGPLLLALAAVYLVDRLTARKGLLPPGFRRPGRRAAGWAVLGGFFWLAIFSPIGMLGLEVQRDVAAIRGPELFLLHGLMAVTLVVWFLLGFAGVREPAARPVAVAAAPVDPIAPPVPIQSGEPVESIRIDRPAVPLPEPVRLPEPTLLQSFARQLGLAAPNIPKEIGLGFALGFGAWLVALGVILVAALALYGAGGEKALPQGVPELIPLIAGLPIWVRILVSLSAGFFEELFFRGFLQPRVGLVLSTLFFAMAHLSYGQPFMLVGITAVSVILGLIVKWRQTIWPAVFAHAVFDGVQLLVIVPIALRYAPHA
jgi:membrane protease YdiL (CAAX protease family)